MSHATQGHPRQGIVRVPTKRGPSEEETEHTPVFLLQEHHEEYEKAKNMTPEDGSLRSEGEGRGHILIASERINHGESRGQII